MAVVADSAKRNKRNGLLIHNILKIRGVDLFYILCFIFSSHITFTVTSIRHKITPLSFTISKLGGIGFGRGS